MIGALLPWTEKTNRFSMKFKTRSIRLLQNIYTFNFTEIMRLSWKQDRPMVIGTDEEFSTERITNTSPWCTT